MIERIEALGGMTKAINESLPKQLIEEAATAKQAAVYKVDDVIVGVNKFRLETEEALEILEIDNAQVRIA